MLKTILVCSCDIGNVMSADLPRTIAKTTNGIRMPPNGQQIQSHGAKAENSRTCNRNGFVQIAFFCPPQTSRKKDCVKKGKCAWKLNFHHLDWRPANLQKFISPFGLNLVGHCNGEYTLKKKFEMKMAFCGFIFHIQEHRMRKKFLIACWCIYHSSILSPSPFPSWCWDCPESISLFESTRTSFFPLDFFGMETKLIVDTTSV